MVLCVCGVDGNNRECALKIIQNTKPEHDRSPCSIHIRSVDNVRTVYMQFNVT